MPYDSTPGVYYERADTGAPAVSPLRTDIAGFVGIAPRGPLHCAVAVESWRQFAAHFGTFTGAGYLAYAVRAFFENGGRRCWVTRVANQQAVAAAAVLVPAAGAPAGQGWRILAATPGVWGNDLDIRLTATHGAQTRGRLTAHPADYAQVDSVSGFARGTQVRIVQDPAKPRWRVLAAVDAERGRLYWVGPRPELRLPYDAPLVGLDAGEPLLIESLEYRLSVWELGRLVASYAGLSLVPEHPRYGPVRLADPYAHTRPAPAAVPPDTRRMADPALPAPVLIEDTRDAATRLALQPLAAPDLPTALVGGADGLAALSVADFIGDPDDPFASDEARARARRGLRTLEAVSEVAVLAVPDIQIQPIAPPRRAPLPPCVPDPCLPPPPPSPAAPRPTALGDLPPRFGEQQIYAVQSALVEQCEALGDRIALLDPPYAMACDDRQGIGPVRAWRRRFDSTYAAFYFPWIKVEDPLRSGDALTRDLPPAGHVAGFYARTDCRSGVHKAPANGPLDWLQDLTVAVDDATHGLLNDEQINAIRAFPGRGLRIFGARTLTSDPDWRYVNVRRLLMMIEKAIELSCQWAVFEPNDVLTRAKLHLSLTSFLLGLWQRGALMGATAREAFVVRCNADNNPPDARAQGQLLAEVGVAPSRPFEFVVLRVGRGDNALEITEVQVSGGSVQWPS